MLLRNPIMGSWTCKWSVFILSQSQKIRWLVILRKRPALWTMQSNVSLYIIFLQNKIYLYNICLMMVRFKLCNIVIMISLTCRPFYITLFKQRLYGLFDCSYRRWKPSGHLRYNFLHQLLMRQSSPGFHNSYYGSLFKLDNVVNFAILALFISSWGS